MAAHACLVIVSRVSPPARRAGLSCPALAASASCLRSAWPAWPLAGRIRPVRGARQGWVLWLRRGCLVGVSRGCFFSFVRGVSGFVGAAAVGSVLAFVGGFGSLCRGVALAGAPLGSVVFGLCGGGGLWFSCGRCRVCLGVGGLVWPAAGGAGFCRWRVGGVGAGGSAAFVPVGGAAGVAASAVGAGLGVGGPSGLLRGTLCNQSRPRES